MEVGIFKVSFVTGRISFMADRLYFSGLVIDNQGFFAWSMSEGLRPCGNI